MGKDPTVFLLSSFTKNPDIYFQGYCFIKENFIFGEGGAESYLRETGEYIPPSEDGCYVIAKKVGDNYAIGSDGAGYKKVLYYHDIQKGVWAVSNSINVLVNHLRANNIKLTPNISALKMMAETQTITQQPLSFNTIANEIFLLPINAILTIGRSTLKVTKYSSRDAESDSESYESILVDFVNMWSSRYATLLSDPDILIEQGLTGGVDSRTIFSLSEVAHQYLGENIRADFRLKSGLTRGSDIDLKVAQSIGSFYGRIINDRSEITYKPKPLSNARRYEIWKNISLGLYKPIYIPGTEISYKKITIGGQGGENYRAQYGRIKNVNNYDDFIMLQCKKLSDSNLKVKLALDMYRAIMSTKQYYPYGEDIDDLTLHYIQFRSRFHAGLLPQYRVSFTPLSSRYLASIVTKNNFNKIKSSQILYDLINLTEGLLDIPFDYDKKAPEPFNIQQLMNIKSSISLKVGRIFKDNNRTYQDYIKSEQPLYSYLKEDFERAKQTGIVQRIWNKEFIDEATKTMDKAVVNNKLGHATEGIPISSIIAAGLFAT